MTKMMELDIVTPDGVFAGDTIEALVVPALDGYLGVLPNHAPLVTALRPGPVKYVKNGQSNYLTIGSGFLEVFRNRITLLADWAEHKT